MSSPREKNSTIQVAPLTRLADLTPATVNEEQRTVEVTFSTGADVERYDWWTDKRWIERLSLDPKHVRLGRLNAGGPVLDTHSSYSVDDMLGAVVPGSASVDGKTGIATLKFSRRQKGEDAFRDAKDGVLRNVSVGYRVYRFEEQAASKTNALPIRTATDWEPYEVSMVPMPADAGAQTRGAQQRASAHDLYSCELVTRVESAAASPSPESPMENERTESETIAERNPLDPGAPTGAAPAARSTATEEPTEAQRGAAAEQARINGIMLACRAGRLPLEFQTRLISENVSLVDAQTRVFEEMKKRGADLSGPSVSATRTDVSVGDDPMVHVRAGIENALTHRLAPEFFKLNDKGRLYRGMSLLDVARVYLQGRGIRVTDMGKSQLAGVALGLTDSRSGGMHTTADFANLLADVATKTLRAAYDEQPQTWRPLVRFVSLTDFKPVNRVQLGDAPALKAVNEHGEFESGTISDGKVTYQLKTYGRKFAITRQALINDDTDAFSRVPMMFGRKARVLESNLVWEQITSNPVMGDGTVLFHANHDNVASDGSRITVKSLGAARGALRRQTSLDGDYLNLNAAFLLVPTTLETEADQFVTVVTPQEAGKVNPFQNKLQVIAEPRLDAASEISWYVAASPTAVDIIEVGYLEGEEGPMVESRVGFDVDGLEVKARLDVVAKAIDWRGLFKDPGELDS